MFHVMEKVFGIEETWNQCLGSFDTEEEARICEGLWERNGRWVFVRSDKEEE